MLHLVIAINFKLSLMENHKSIQPNSVTKNHHKSQCVVGFTSSMQEYKIDNKVRIITKVSLLVFIAFLALGFISPFLPGDKAVNLGGTIGFILLFGALSTFAWLAGKKIPFANVAVDDKSANRTCTLVDYQDHEVYRPVLLIVMVFLVWAWMGWVSLAHQALARP